MERGWSPGEAGFGLQLGTLTMSFQRFELPNTGVVRVAPRSLGALPIARARNGRLLLPVDDKEAFWIGLSSREEVYLVQLGALLNDGTGTQLGEEAQAVPPDTRIIGWSAAGTSYCALSRVATGSALGVESIYFAARRVASRDAGPIEDKVFLVDYAEYSAATLRPPPERIDPSAGYGGQLLP